MVILLLLIIQMVLAFAEITTRLECIDSKLTATLEYVSVLRYKTVRTDPINYSCTLITQCSVDRLQRLNIQIRGWRGASSVAVYIPTKNRDQQLNDLNKLDSYLKNLEIDPLFNGFLTVSVLFGHESTPQLWNCKELHSPGMPLYPINALRNLAAAATGEQLDPTSYISPYLFYLDVDFVPSVGLSAWVDNQHSIGGRGDGSLHHLTHSGGLVVVPAFESTVTTSISSARSLQYLMDGVRSELIHPFHVKRYPAGHGNTNFDKWKKLSVALQSEPENIPFAPYKVQYTQGFEPYVILARKYFVPYDERFRGYGYNKCVNLRWFADKNMTFYVLPGHFVVEDAHANSVTYNKTALNVPVLNAAYIAARRDIKAGRMPLISQKTAELLRAGGFGFRGCGRSGDP